MFHKDESNSERRYRNIVAAIDNLLNQLDAEASDEIFKRLSHMRDLYQSELNWHRRVRK